MYRVLVLYYSQSGEVARAARSFVKHLDTPQVELAWEQIRPTAGYPYPWNSLYRFFDVFPECINQDPPEIHPPSFQPTERFDLIIFAYQVWFLAPSLPALGFLKSQYAEVLRGTRVITLVVCRNMWHSASEAMKELIAERGGVHIDNVVVTHQGPPLITFVTTPRMLFTGKRDRFLGIFPRAGTRQTEIEGLERFGRAIARNLGALRDDDPRPLLRDMNAVEVNPRYAVLERLGRLVYGPWAKVARLFGKPGSWQRRPIIYLFVGYLAVSLPIAVPLVFLVQLLFAPLFGRRLEAYVYRLKSPSGVA